MPWRKWDDKRFVCSQHSLAVHIFLHFLFLLLDASDIFTRAFIDYSYLNHCIARKVVPWWRAKIISNLYLLRVINLKRNDLNFAIRRTLDVGFQTQQFAILLMITNFLLLWYELKRKWNMWLEYASNCTGACIEYMKQCTKHRTWNRIRNTQCMWFHEMATNVIQMLWNNMKLKTMQQQQQQHFKITQNLDVIPRIEMFHQKYTGGFFLLSSARYLRPTLSNGIVFFLFASVVVLFYFTFDRN